MISVIIPVYNGGGYISTIYSCIKEQTYSDLEIIFVNDGSTDNSGDILNKIASEDSRVIVIHQKNSGVSAARNAALKMVSREYTAFLDVDDTIDKEYMEQLLGNARNTGADIVCSGFREIEPQYIEKLQPKLLIEYDEEMLQSYSEYSQAFFDRKHWIYSVWAKLFRSDFAKQIEFYPIRYGEDTLYMYEICKRFVPKIYTFPYVGYNYIRWEQSATKNAEIKNRTMEDATLRLRVMHYYLQLDKDNGFDCNRISKYFMFFVYSYLNTTITTNKKSLYFSDEFEKQVYFEQYKQYINRKNVSTLKILMVLKLYLFSKRLCWVAIKMFSKSNSN